MFIRNNSSTAQEIAKAFIRNSSGVAEEISKIYIRDASGNAVLVFDSTPVVILDCPNCTGDTVSVYYTVSGFGDAPWQLTNPTTFTTTTIPSCGSNITQNISASATVNATLASLYNRLFPSFDIDKNYWSKTSTSYAEAKIKNNGIEDTTNSFYTTLTQTLNAEPCPALGYSDHTNSPWNSDGGANFTGAGLVGLCFPEYYSSKPTAANNLNANTVFSLDTRHFTCTLLNKLKASFDFVTNYPIIPGYIIIDYLSENSKSTIFAFHKKPSYLFTSHGKNIRNPNDNSTLNRLDIGRAIAHGFYDQDSTTVGIRDGENNLPNRKTSIYPFYNKVICFEFPGDSTLDDLQLDDGGGTHCGQEYCAGIYGLHKFRTWFNVGPLDGPPSNVYAPCLNWAYQPIGALLKNSLRSLNTAKAWLENSTSFNFFYQGSVGKKFCNLGASTSPGTFRQDTQDVSSSQLSTASTNIPCNTTATASGLISRDFVKPELNNTPTNPFSPNVNPLSWVLYAEKVQTQKTLPTVTASADVDDCCKNCAYGPISFDGQKDASNNFILNGCRHVYQLPPINSLDPTNFTNTNRRAAFSFMKDFVVGAALNVNDIALQPSQSSKVKIRFTLPAYVELDSSLKSKIVKMKQTDAAIQSFCTTSHTPNTANASVFNALQNFIGVNLLSAFNSNFYSEITNTSDLIYLSSSSFYYEENRFDSLDQDGVPREKGMLSKLRDAGNTNIPSALPSGDTGSSDVLNQRPLIYWSIAGWPSEKHTHYIVVEIELDKNETCLTYLDMSQLKFNNQSSNHNLTKLIKGISFYPLHFTTSFLQGKLANSAGALLTNHFIHPAFLSYIIADSTQNMPDFGFRNGATPGATTKYKPGFIDYGQGTSALLPTSDLPGVIGNPLTWSFGENSTTGRASLSLIRLPHFIIKQTSDTTAASICFSQNYALPSRFSYQSFINKFYANAFSLSLP